jgi:hypothetical protein
MLYQWTMQREVEHFQCKEWTESIPQAEIMLEHFLTAQVFKVKVKGERISRVGAHSLREENYSVTSGDVEPVQHCLGQYI